jgi:hypothetical protein
MRTSSTSVTTRGPIRREGEAIEATVLERIGASAPYFALQDLVFDGAELRGHAPAETDPGTETGPVSAAELARHAVVAGLSAVALGRPDAARCYYLVSELEATFLPSDIAFGASVSYSARATQQNPVGGAAQIEAHVEHELVGHVRASFAVIPETLFLKLFVRHRTATYGDMGSHKIYPPLDGITCDRHAAQARLVVPRSSCRGHFDQHPALPVPVMVGQLVRLTSSLAEGKFRVTALHVKSPALAWAGDELRLRVAKATSPWSFTGHAAVAGRTVASVRLAVARLARPGG